MKHLVPLLLLMAAPLAAAGDWAAVERAARAEGRLVIYSAALANPVFPDIVRNFERRYGIEIDILEARPTELRERLRTERAARRSLADLSHTGATSTALMMRDGLLAPHDGLPAAARLAAPFADQGTALPTYVVTYGMLANTSLVTPDALPRRWIDLLQPRWRARIVCDDLRSLGAGGVFTAVMLTEHGAGFHSRFAAQHPVLSLESRLNELRVARGEYALYVPFPLANIFDLDGLPVRVVVPEEGTPYIRFETALLADARHPHAARLFLNHLLTEESQLLLANRGFGPVITDVADKVTGRAAAFARLPLLGTTDPATIEKALEAAKIYGH